MKSILLKIREGKVRGEEFSSDLARGIFHEQPEKKNVMRDKVLQNSNQSVTFEHLLSPICIAYLLSKLYIRVFLNHLTQ